MKLTQEQKQIKLAEAAGWRLFSQFKNLWAPPGHVVEYDCDAYPLPDYFVDLNAVHDLEMKLDNEYPTHSREYFRKQLRKICQPHIHEVHATAALRAEALGLTLNLWTP